MIDRLSTALSVCLHLAMIVLLGTITFDLEQEEVRKTGMEIEIIDLEHAMPSARPAIAKAAAPSLAVSDRQSSKLPDRALRAASLTAASPDVQSTRAKAAPVAETRAPAAQAAPVPVPARSPNGEAPAQAERASPAQKAQPKVAGLARLDAAALARSSAIGGAAPAKQTRLNSATIGSAIGKAAPSGLPGLTFRQKIDLAQKVREQVMPCWNPPVAEGAGFASVRLRFRLDRGGRVVGQPSQSGSTGQTRTNAAYINLLTNSGRRAVILCAPLQLPPELYEAWAEVEVEFDPRDLR